jgi:hypothetical protein
MNNYPVITRVDRIIHFWALWSLAICQPIYLFMRRSPEFLVLHRFTWNELIITIFGLTLLIPLVIVIILELLDKFFTNLVQQIYYIAMLIFSFIAFTQSLRATSLGEWKYILVITLIFAYIFIRLYQRLEIIRSLCTLLIAGAFVAPILLLKESQVRHVFENNDLAQRKVSHEDLKPKIPIFVIIWDELPLPSLLTTDKKINDKMFPNFSKLANDSVWFRHASSVAAATYQAVPAILSSQYPNIDQPRLPIYTDYPQNLFTELANYYHINAWEQFTHLCPDAICSDDNTEISTSERFLYLLQGVLELQMRTMFTEEEFLGLSRSLGTLQMSVLDLFGYVTDFMQEDYYSIWTGNRVNINNDTLLFELFLKDIQTIKIINLH